MDTKANSLMVTCTYRAAPNWKKTNKKTSWACSAVATRNLDFPSVLIIRSFAAFSLVVFVDGCSVPWNVCRKSWGDVALRMCFYTHTHVCNKVYEFHPSQSQGLNECVPGPLYEPPVSIWTQFPLLFSSDRHFNRRYVNVKHLHSSPELIPIVCVHVNTTSEEMTATENHNFFFFPLFVKSGFPFVSHAAFRFWVHLRNTKVQTLPPQCVQLCDIQYILPKI